MSDVKLDGNKVVLESDDGNNLTLEGPLLKAQAWDFWLWHPARLRAGTPPNPARRAMIHTFSDGVGINVMHDYPGGVEIGGDVKILDRLSVTEIENDKRRAIVHATGDVLGINLNRDFPDGVLIGGVIRFYEGLEIKVTTRAHGVETRFQVKNNGEIASQMRCRVPSGYAELVAGPAHLFETGDVLIISDNGIRTVELSKERESSKVAGIYSKTHGILGSKDPMKDIDESNEVPMAVAGIVPCKVVAMFPEGNGHIRRGDLLTTSGLQGHAMKAEDPKPGTILGKAFGEWKDVRNNGIIDVLVMLQ